MKIFSSILAAAVLAGCVSVSVDRYGPEFSENIGSDNKPWSHTSFDNADDKFTFAVFSDLTGGERERVFEIAVAQLNLLRPELIVNVGDLIEGDSGSADGVHDEWESFDERADRARAPVFYVGGNHDLTGELLRDVWTDRLGPTWYHFVYKDVLFVVLDTDDNTPERIREIEQIRNEGLRVADTEGWDAFYETEYAKLPERSFGNLTQTQIDEVIGAINANAGVRWTFVLMHKPAWRREESGFSQIEDALAGRSYTVFIGHEHVYQHIERRGQDYIFLGTTGGVQFPDRGQSIDHVTLVTVDDDGVDIANLAMSGIRDKTGHIPLGGDDVCFEAAECPEEPEE